MQLVNPQIITKDFMGDASQVVNVDKLKQIFIDKCSALMERVGKDYYFISDIYHELVNTPGSDYHYFYFETLFTGAAYGMKRYHLGVYSSLLIDLHYYDSNVIDADKKYTIEDVKQRFRSFVKALHRDICEQKSPVSTGENQMD